MSSSLGAERGEELLVEAAISQHACHHAQACFLAWQVYMYPLLQSAQQGLRAQAQLLSDWTAQDNAVDHAQAHASAHPQGTCWM